MNEKLYDALEVCLNALETGVDLESVLKLYPDLADELRPVLEASLQARTLALPAVPEAALQRGRARVLAHANAMRKSTPKPRKRWSLFAIPRLAASMAITLVFLLSATGLVSASNGALPGDSLYPVKRSWEDLRLLLVFSPEKRVGLESEFEQERLDEISELLTEGRYEPIAFAGLVTAQGDLEWKVSGITIMITPSTHLPADGASVGVPVMVIGHTNAQGFVEADTLEVLGPGVSLPPLEPSQMENVEVENEEAESHESASETKSDQQPEQLGTLTYEFKGVVESMNGNIWTINGQDVNVEFAEKQAAISVGVLAEFEGYYSIDGQFIVTKIEVKSNDLLIEREPLKSSGQSSDGTDDNSDSSQEIDNGNESDANSNDSQTDDHQDDDKKDDSKDESKDVGDD